MGKDRTRYHHGDLRRALLDAVLDLVVEQGGTGGITLREAARRVGVSHNAPYRHFDDKGAVLAAIASEGFADLSEALRDARAAEDAEERFQQTGLAYLRFAQQHRGHVLVMFGPEINKGRTPELQRAANETFQLLKALAADAGVTDEVARRRLGLVVWSFLHGLGALASDAQVPASVGATPDEIAELGLGHLFRSFRAESTG